MRRGHCAGAAHRVLPGDGRRHRPPPRPVGRRPDGALTKWPWPACPTRRWPTRSWAPRCCTRRHDRPAQGILRPLADEPGRGLPLFGFLQQLWRAREGMIHLSPAPLYHSAPLANTWASRCATGHGHRDGAVRRRALPAADRTPPRSPARRWCPTMFSRLLKLPSRGAQPLRPAQPGDRHPRRRALPGAGEGADDRVVGPHHPRVLRRHRRPGLHRLRQRRSGWRTRAPWAAC